MWRLKKQENPVPTQYAQCYPTRGPAPSIMLLPSCLTLLSVFSSGNLACLGPWTGQRTRFMLECRAKECDVSKHMNESIVSSFPKACHFFLTSSQENKRRRGRKQENIPRIDNYANIHELSHILPLSLYRSSTKHTPSPPIRLNPILAHHVTTHGVHASLVIIDVLPPPLPSLPPLVLCTIQTR